MIEDCILNWDQMDGETDLEKQANAILTTLFILRLDIPADECLSEARKLIGLRQAGGDWQGDALAYLEYQFATGLKPDGTDPVRLEGRLPGCANALRLFERLCLGQPWTAQGLESLLGD